MTQLLFYWLIGFEIIDMIDMLSVLSFMRELSKNNCIDFFIYNLFNDFYLMKKSAISVLLNFSYAPSV